MSAIRLYQRFDKPALVAMSQALDADPANRPDPALGSIYLLSPAARKQSAAIAQAIAWHIEDERKVAGCPVPVAGYSGRSSNRR